MAFLKIIFVLLGFIYSGVEPHSGGAPDGACSSMLPGHGLTPQVDDAPITSVLSAGKVIFNCLCMYLKNR